MLIYPFDLTSFIRLVRPLESVLERNYWLCSRVAGFTLGDLLKTPARLLDWYYGRAIKDYNDEQEEIERANNS
jgi:hypothetical protein